MNSYRIMVEVKSELYLQYVIEAESPDVAHFAAMENGMRDSLPEELEGQVGSITGEIHDYTVDVEAHSEVYLKYDVEAASLEEAKDIALRNAKESYDSDESPARNSYEVIDRD